MNRLFRFIQRLARRRFYALLAVGAIVTSGLAFAEPKPNPYKLKAQSLAVKATPLSSFDKVNIGRTTFGSLEWIGGLRLKSTNKSFGGLSGLAIDPDGTGFVAVSDAGTWITGAIDRKGAKATGISRARIGPLLALSGQPLGRDRDRDAEAVALSGGTVRNGRLLIAFEQNHRIGRFNISKAGVTRPSSYVAPRKPDPRIRSGKGFEAIAVLEGGRFRGSLVAIAERRHSKQGHHSGWIWVRGQPKRFSIVDKGGHDITDVASLPDGGMLLLERRFRWLEGIRFRIRHIPARVLRPGAVLDGEVLIESDLSQNIDNMEALAVRRDAGGGFVLTVLSDDNFNPILQQTLLLEFKWRPSAQQVSVN
ncbi:MAG: esterase-like activity of phytase family protein [Pseudomonadota bacterium]